MFCETHCNDALKLMDLEEKPIDQLNLVVQLYLRQLKHYSISSQEHPR